MAKKRKGLSKKDRFEVFKRDGFTCQYCGREAPDIVLNVDHIKPVKSGGSNDMLNLITSCWDCNSGKKAIHLSDDTAVKKQKKQMKELQEKNEQLEMIIKWRDELQDIIKKEFEYVEEIFKSKTGYGFSASGKKTLKKQIKKHGIKRVADAMDTSIDQYIEYEDDQVTKDSAEKILKYYPKILSNEKKFNEKPYLKDLYYIRGILRNRLHYFNEWKALKGLEELYEKGVSIESLKEMALTVRNWSSFKRILEDQEVYI